MKHLKNRKYLFLSLAMASVLTAAEAFPAMAAEYPYSQYLSGENAENLPESESGYTLLTLSTEADLLQLAADCQLDSWSRDKYIRLENDIALEENTNIIIPSFAGIFDGNGHKITGLQITASGSALGLFRYIQSNGILRNLTVSGTVLPDGEGRRCGILAGVNYGRIQNCSVSGQVAGSEETGGICGLNETSGEIRRCQSSAVITGEHYTGGICGTNKGTLNNCTNTGNVNAYNTNVTYDLEDITLETLQDLNNPENVAAHMDTGGITGYSEGKIYYCSNSGTVGYQHVGYNTGGIAGRLHQGYIQNCTNTGHVLGRKDVGGIAGQMEPFLEIQFLNDKLSEIDRETDVFFDLLEAASDDLHSYSQEASDLISSISGHLTNASAAAGNLMGTANELWYLYNQELTGFNSDLNRLNQELADQAAKDKADTEIKADTTPPESGLLEALMEQHGIADSHIPDDDSGNSITDNNHIPGENASETNSTDNEISFPNDTLNGISAWAAPNADIESYIAALRRFGESTGSHIANITNGTNDRSGGINSNLDTLNSEFRAAGNQLRQLADVLERSGDTTSANIDALLNQVKVLRRLINELRDELFRYEGISIEDASDETAGTGMSGEDADGSSPTEGAGSYTAENTDSNSSQNPSAEAEEAYYDTTSFQQGKITLCLNSGNIEADTNVGGIVGQISTEYDFDPEDDITLTGVESFNLEQTVKAVVRESRNNGTITGKKDYAGGIVGKADNGAIISCESYGSVSTSGGSYVGGIAGLSGYCIRNCYFSGSLSGKNYVGGIAGSGGDVFYSYAYPEIEYSGEYAGSIAGWLEENGTLYENYYVQGSIPGVDSIGYEGGATPLAYEVFCSREEVPDIFRAFTISFEADGVQLASIQCNYGESLDRTQIPDIPEKEGYYGTWPEFDYDHITRNQTLEAQYEKWISTLAGSETSQDGRPVILVQGEFLPENQLQTETTPEGTSLSILSAKEDSTVTEQYEKPILVRVLYDNTESSADKAVAELWNGENYVQLPTTVVGSYLEFQMERPGTFRITMPQDNDSMIILVVCAGVVVLLLLILLLRKMIKHKKTQ